MLIMLTVTIAALLYCKRTRRDTLYFLGMLISTTWMLFKGCLDFLAWLDIDISDDHDTNNGVAPHLYNMENPGYHSMEAYNLYYIDD